jgi:NarL family two-component system response regulator LiaR
MSAARVLLVDDHRVVIQGLEVLLASFSAVEVAGTATSGAEAIEEYGRLRPDVVLMDLSMTGMGGVETTRALRRLDPDARVVVLSGFVTENLVDDVIAAGACGYLLKSISGSDLVDAIVAAAGGRATFSGEALSLLPSRSSPPRLGHDLTARELDVLGALAQGQSNREIGATLSMSAGTVRVHVSNILTKLNAENRTKAAFIAQQSGLIGAASPGTGLET